MLLIKRLALLFFAIVFSFIYCFGQDTSNTIGKVSISSPTAASLGKYGDIPIGFHTGTPDVSIPIYTVKSGGLNLPISVSYHGSGIKVSEQAGWVGIGWALNAGGVITRTVIGAADDRGYQSYQGAVNACLKGHYSDYGFSSNIVYGTDTSLYGNQLATADNDLRLGRMDGEPDLYFFNFGSYTGKFYFNDDRSVVLVPEEDFKIQPDYQLGPGFNGFIITTPDGNKYYFGRTGNYSSSSDPVESTITTTLANGPSYGSAAASAWYLNKIISPDGTDSITFQYQSEKYSSYVWSTFPTSDYVGVNFGVPDSRSQQNGVDLVKNMINGVRLSQVNFANGKVSFTPSQTPRKDLSNATWASMADVTSDSTYSLGSIKISDNTNTFCKKDSFYYSYFHCTQTGFSSTFWVNDLDIFDLHSDTTVLRLDSIQEISCDQSIKNPPYRFSYFSETMPRRLSYGVDHWGYYNGQDYNPGLIPTYIKKGIDGIFKKVVKANRDASWPAMRAGSLEKIIYPTGGSTLFEFEPHTTHLNFSSYTDSSRGSYSIAYDGHDGYLGDGGDNPIQITVHFSGNPYQLIAVNTDNGISGSDAQITLKNTSNVSVYGVTLSRGQTDTTYITLTAGDYTLFMQKYNPTTGYGAYLQVTEWVPYSVDTNAIVGGLRIRTVTNSDSLTAKKIVTNYSYNYANNDSTGTSSGILYSRPVYIQWVRSDVFSVVYDQHYICDYPSIYLSGGSIRPMQTTQGNHIGYNEVYVSQPNNGYSVYKYYGSDIWDYNVSDVCTRFVDGSLSCSAPSLPAVPVPFEFKRGILKYTGIYNQANQIVKDTWHYYDYVPDSVTTLGHISQLYWPPNIVTFAEYALQSASKIKDSTDVTEYDIPLGLNLTQSEATYYESKFHHMPTRRVSKSSKGESIIQKFKYAADFQPPNFTTPDSLFYYKNSSHTDSVNMFTELSAYSNTYDINSPRFVIFQHYRANLALDRARYIGYRRRTFTDMGNVYSAAHDSAKNAAGAELKPIYELQDEYQNAMIEQTQWRDTNFLHARFNRYDYATNSSGKVYPQKTMLINLSTPSSSFTSASISGTTVTKDTRYKDETSYIFSVGHPIQSSVRSGLTTSYIWDYLAKEPIAEIVNADTSRIAYSSFEADGLGGWTKVSGSSIDASKGITGSKSFSGTLTKKMPLGNYIITLWSNISGTESVNGVSGTLLSTKGIYALKEWDLNNVDSVWVIGSNMDEVRLYPRGSQMKTYTYSPLLGMTSSCDVSNYITYYEYDRLGRLIIIRDQDKNIIKKYCYNLFGQIGGDCSLYGNTMQTETFTKNCGTDSVGSTIIDTVLANTYYASTQIAADSLALSDISLNGQAYANAYGTCTYVPCDSISCPGPNKKCISGHCEVGGRYNVSTTRIKVNGVFVWQCVYHYCWSDSSTSADFTETNSSACSPIGVCIE